MAVVQAGPGFYNPFAPSGELTQTARLSWRPELNRVTTVSPL